MFACSPSIILLAFDDIAVDPRLTLDAVCRPQGQDEGVQIVDVSVAELSESHGQRLGPCLGQASADDLHSFEQLGL